MCTTFEVAKFARLRAKTDRQLVGIIERDLDHGLRLSRNTDAAFDGNRNSAECRLQVQQAVAEAIQLLPLVYGLSQADRYRLEAKVQQLRDSLAAWPKVQTAGT
jgi:hypothetical protein